MVAPPFFECFFFKLFLFYFFIFKSSMEHILHDKLPTYYLHKLIFRSSQHTVISLIKCQYVPKSAALQHCKCHKLANRQNHLQIYFSRLRANSAMHLPCHNGGREERRQSGERKQVVGPASGEAAARGACSCSPPRTLVSSLWIICVANCSIQRGEPKI